MQSGDDKSDSLFSYKKEMKLALDSADIVDELRMIQHLIKNQRAVIDQLDHEPRHDAVVVLEHTSRQIAEIAQDASDTNMKVHYTNPLANPTNMLMSYIAPRSLGLEAAYGNAG